MKNYYLIKSKLIFSLIILLFSCSKEDVYENNSNQNEPSYRSTNGGSSLVSFQGINTSIFVGYFETYKATTYEGRLFPNTSPNTICIVDDLNGQLFIEGVDDYCNLTPPPFNLQHNSGTIPFHMDKSTSNPITWYYLHPHKYDRDNDITTQMNCAPNRTVLKLAPKGNATNTIQPQWPSTAHPANPRNAFFHFNYWTCEWEFALNATDYFWYTTPPGFPGNNSGC